MYPTILYITYRTRKKGACLNLSPETSSHPRPLPHASGKRNRTNQPRSKAYTTTDVELTINQNVWNVLANKVQFENKEYLKLSYALFPNS